MTTSPGVSVDGVVEAVSAAFEASRKVAHALKPLRAWCDDMSPKVTGAADEVEQLAQRIANLQFDVQAGSVHVMDASALAETTSIGEFERAAAEAPGTWSAFVEAARAASASLTAARDAAQTLSGWVETVSQELRRCRREARYVKADPGLRSVIERTHALVESLRGLLYEAPGDFWHAARRDTGPEEQSLGGACVAFVRAITVAAETAESLNAALREISGS
ncbi:MAG TPA: hypothetical protein VIP77_19710 [Jiangellaceae bacterium]